MLIKVKVVTITRKPIRFSYPHDGQVEGKYHIEYCYFEGDRFTGSEEIKLTEDELYDILKQHLVKKGIAKDS